MQQSPLSREICFSYPLFNRDMDVIFVWELRDPSSVVVSGIHLYGFNSASFIITLVAAIFSRSCREKACSVPAVCTAAALPFVRNRIYVRTPFLVRLGFC